MDKKEIVEFLEASLENKDQFLGSIDFQQRAEAVLAYLRSQEAPAAYAHPKGLENFRTGKETRMAVACERIGNYMVPLYAGIAERGEHG